MDDLRGAEGLTCPLFAALADLLRRLPAGAATPLASLNELLTDLAPGALSGGGAPIRFVKPQPCDPLGYEARIHQEGTVPTRPDDWHDFFNALVWCAFPRAKSALNARHVAELPGRPASRGSVRDALTHFDECGILAVAADPMLPELLSAHRWEEAFWDRRKDVEEKMRFVVFGHATYDRLRAPFFGLCGKTVYRVVEEDWFARSSLQQRQDLDAWLALRIADPGRFRHPREFPPLPLLGIPGVTAASESAAYYRDGRQFRPKR